MVLGEVEVDLVSPDAEAADSDQARGLLQDRGGVPRIGPDADEIRIADGLDQLVLGKRFRVVFDLCISVSVERGERGLMHALEQQNLDFGLIEGDSIHYSDDSGRIEMAMSP